MVRNALFAALVAVAAAGSTLSAGPALSQTSGAALSAPASDADREAFRAEVRAYLMEHPEVIFEAVAEYERRQQAAQADMDLALVQINADDIFHDDHSWVTGNPDGDVTLVEFMDYRCGYCRKAQAEVEELIASDGNIRFVVREFPILGENSLVSSRFALAVRAVAGDDAYKAAHDALMTLSADATEPALRRLAETLGLDAEAVLAGMKDPEIDRIIGETRALAQVLQINGTPTFVMGTQMLRGYVPLEAMRQIAQDVREAG